MGESGMLLLVAILAAFGLTLLVLGLKEGHGDRVPIAIGAASLTAALVVAFLAWGP